MDLFKDKLVTLEVELKLISKISTQEVYINSQKIFLIRIVHNYYIKRNYTINTVNK